jgi:predicted nuclease of predicted toxin-antitoxin system
VRDLGLRGAKDNVIFQQARQANAVVMTKDGDFVELVERLGAPPQILWIKCGNTTNARLRQILEKCLPLAIPLLDHGESIIEIDDAP